MWYKIESAAYSFVKIIMKDRSIQEPARHRQPLLSEKEMKMEEEQLDLVVGVDFGMTCTGKKFLSLPNRTRSVFSSLFTWT